MVNEKHAQVSMLEAMELFQLLNTWQTGLNLQTLTSAMRELWEEYNNFRQESNPLDVITLLHAIANLKRHVQKLDDSSTSHAQLLKTLTSSEVDELKEQFAQTTVLLLRQILSDVVGDNESLSQANIELVLKDVVFLWDMSIQPKHTDDLISLTTSYLHHDCSSNDLNLKLKLALCLYESSLFHEDLVVSILNDIADADTDALLSSVDSLKLLSFVLILREFPAHFTAQHVTGKQQLFSRILDDLARQSADVNTEYLGEFLRGETLLYVLTLLPLALSTCPLIYRCTM